MQSVNYLENFSLLRLLAHFIEHVMLFFLFLKSALFDVTKGTNRLMTPSVKC